jgi:hypothetical protein
MKPARGPDVVIPTGARLANQIPAMNMKPTPQNLLLVALVASVAALTGCAGVDARIAKNREAFSSWPPQVQEQVAAGRIDLGFTTDQVRVALGEPDRVFTRTSADGTTEVWSYRERRPRFGIGVGVGMGGFSGSRAVGGTVGIGTGSGYRDDEKLGVVFDRMGRVAEIETR